MGIGSDQKDVQNQAAPREGNSLLICSQIEEGLLLMARGEMDPKVVAAAGINHKVLEPGWGGLLTLAEAEFIACELAKPGNRALRRAWGFGGRTTFPLVQVAAKAFPENPKEARRNMLNQMEQARAYQKKANAGENLVSVTPEPKAHRIKASPVPGQAYCLKCRGAQQLIQAVVVGVTDKGAQRVKGKCGTCGAAINTFVSIRADPTSRTPATKGP